MANRKIVKDRLYYFAEETGVQKSDWHLIFNVSETTLKKWSYNPANVSEKTRKHIMTRIRMWDALHVQCRKIVDIPKFQDDVNVYSEYGYRVRYGSNTVLIGYESSLPHFLNMVLEHAIVTCSSKAMAYILDPKTISYRNGALMKIALNDLHEMPLGVTVWDDSLTPLMQPKKC